MKGFGFLLPAVLLSACAANPDSAAPSAPPPAPEAPSVSVPAASPSENAAALKAAMTADPSKGKYYYSDIQEAINNHTRYPDAAIRRREQGIAALRVTIGRDGRILNTTLIQHTRYRDLDAEALAAVKRVGTFAPMPANFSPTITKVDIEMPITFSLDNTAYHSSDPRLPENQAAFNTWAEQMNTAINQKWARPEGADKNLATAVRIIVSPNGEVLGTRIITASGDQAYDDSVIQAIDTASPFAVPADSTLYFSAISLCFSLAADKCQ